MFIFSRDEPQQRFATTTQHTILAYHDLQSCPCGGSIAIMQPVGSYEHKHDIFAISYLNATSPNDLGYFQNI